MSNFYVQELFLGELHFEHNLCQLQNKKTLHTKGKINTKQSGKLGLYTKSTMQAVFVIILCEA